MSKKREYRGSPEQRDAAHPFETEHGWGYFRKQVFTAGLIQRRGLIAALALSSIFSVSLSFFRFSYGSKITLRFLIWNLFLAIIPFGISLLIDAHKKSDRRYIIFLLMPAWLLFFPNAPYLVTDLVHLRERVGVPFWFDLFLIASYVWNGLLLGYASLFLIHEKITSLYNSKVAWCFSIGALVLSAFGIYLGRFLRWNSWDVFSNPAGLFYEIFDRILNPFSHPRTWGITLIASLFLITGYIGIRQISLLGRNSTSTEDV